MGFRFRKSIRIAPGVRINLGRRGVSSLNVGGFNFGKRGVYQNVHIPGTGISYRSKIVERPQGRNLTRPSQTPKTARVPITLRLGNDGSVDFLDGQGRPLSEELNQLARKQNKERILLWLQEKCDKYNAEIEALLRIHLTTPAPAGEVFVNPKPKPPKFDSHGLMSALSVGYRQKLDERNKQLQQEYEAALIQWERAEHALRTDTEVMSAVLSNAFESLQWPRETLISFEIVDEGCTVLLDVDLPEIEDMPTQEAQVSKRDLRLVMKERSQSQRQLDYLTHIHAIGFRFVGDVFAHLPSASTVVISGYSQRVNKKTGNTENEYLYSARVLGEVWERINFDNLDALDVVACFESFELRRNVTKRGAILPIEPFETVVAPQAKAAESRCAKCGVANPPEYRFCGNCGTPLLKPGTSG